MRRVTRLRDIRLCTRSWCVFASGSVDLILLRSTVVSVEKPEGEIHTKLSAGFGKGRVLSSKIRDFLCRVPWKLFVFSNLSVVCLQPYDDGNEGLCPLKVSFILAWPRSRPRRCATEPQRRLMKISATAVFSGRAAKMF